MEWGFPGNMAKGLGLGVSGLWDPASRRTGKRLPAPAWRGGSHVADMDAFERLYVVVVLNVSSMLKEIAFPAFLEEIHVGFPSHFLT